MNTTEKFDVVIVGAGISGAIIAEHLGKIGSKKKDFRVLVLEAGTGAEERFFDQPEGDNGTVSQESYNKYMQQFFTANIKIPNSPYPNNKNAPQPLVTDVDDFVASNNTPWTKGYFVQKGPQPFSSSYTRSEGGTTLHWLGTCLRMLPEDFKLNTKYDRGLDWPIGYNDLQIWYEKAEHGIGVSGNANEQSYMDINNPAVHIPFEKSYDYPMEKIPQSFLDQQIAQGLEGMTVRLTSKGKDKEYHIPVVSTPQARNGMPRGEYRPVGAVGYNNLGQRCAGNSNCVPICPIQAKYNALKTLSQARATGHVEIRNKCVVYGLDVDNNKQISKVHYKRYESPSSTEHHCESVCAEIVVLAAHAVENAKILLAAGVANSSGQVGRNLMDHPTILTWGLMPHSIGAFRGPGSTSGIPSLRGGAFRSDHAAFRIEIGNWGWNWPTAAPIATASDLIDNNKLFGDGLKQHLQDIYPRMFRFGFLVEQLPDTNNKITIDPCYKDNLNNYRPIIEYHVDDYTRAGMAEAKRVSDQIFQHLGVEQHTEYKKSDSGYITYNDKGYTYNGAGHLVGTHIMGIDNKTSVVDSYQRSWDNPNLYLVGCGSMPTISTSNPTLTMAALAYRTANNIAKTLKIRE